MAITTAEPKSQHVADPALQPFLRDDFDPAEYLNATLPAIAPAARGATAQANSLSELSSQLQTLLSQLNAQTSRLSNTLTQLTDEIVRSGGRLAYEVEVLRGEALAMSDVMEESIKEEIKVFVPPEEPKAETAEAPAEAKGEGEESKTVPATSSAENAAPHEIVVPGEPEFLVRLRTLMAARERLDAVVKTFGSAMQWPLAPSEIAPVSSSLISVSAPVPENPEQEAKGKAYVENLQSEINAMLAAGLEGLETARTRVEELRGLAEVWKGTTEEKARIKIVENMQKLVDDRARALGTGKKAAGSSRIMDYRYGGFDGSAVTSKLPNITKTATAGGYGFLQNLRDFKNEMYSAD